MALSQVRVHEVRIVVTAASHVTLLDGACVEMPTVVGCEIDAVNPLGGTVVGEIVSPDQISAHIDAINPDGEIVSANMESPDVIENDMEDVHNE